MSGLLITFEGSEGTGKSTQVPLLVSRLRSEGYAVRALREPGGTPIGEEIRHTLKHSPSNGAMTAETELLLMNASRAQLVREVIRPSLAAGEIVVCDRFYDSTVAYQGYGRGLPLESVRRIIDFAVGQTRPDLTLLFALPPEQSEHRRLTRQTQLPFVRDRLEEAGREFSYELKRALQRSPQRNRTAFGRSMLQGRLKLCETACGWRCRLDFETLGDLVSKVSRVAPRVAGFSAASQS
jgi:dTMP kinase